MKLDLGKSVKVVSKKWIAFQDRLRRITHKYKTYEDENKVWEFLEAIVNTIVM